MKRWIVIAVLVIGLVVCGVSWVNTGASLSATRASLREMEADLEAALAEVAFWESVATPEPFGSLEELEDWLAEDDTDDNEYIDGNLMVISSAKILR